MSCHLVKRLLLVTMLLVCVVSTASAQNTISTVAGGGPQGGVATSADVVTPSGVAVDSAGNLYVGQFIGAQVFKVTPAGILNVFAGQNYNGPATGDGGAALNAVFSQTIRVAVDANQNIYVADYANGRVRRIAANTGVITTVAGSATICPGGANQPCGDGGLATQASLQAPEAMAFDTAGDLFIADRGDYRIRRVDATTGIITTVVGTGAQCTSGTCGDGGLATAATLRSGRGVAVDGTGNIYIADGSNVRKVNASTKIISTIATPADGSNYLIVEPVSGELLVSGTNTVYRVDVATFAITELAGANNSCAGHDVGDGGAATSSCLVAPYSVAEDGTGNIYIGQAGSNRVRKIDNSAQHIITTFAGGGSGGDGGQELSAILGYPNGGVIDANGNGYIADAENNRIRRVTMGSTIISTVAGNGEPNGAGDGGAATSAPLSLNFSNSGIAVDGDGNIFVGDVNEQAVRRVDAASGIINKFAGGSGTCATPTAACGDGGAATLALLNTPAGITLDINNNNLFIADSLDNRIRRVDGITGIISTVAGNGTVCANPTAACGDGGLATAANLNGPGFVAVDSNGNLFISDNNDSRVRRVDAVTGKISTVAGNGILCTTPSTACGDGGAATAAALYGPQSVQLDTAGNVFIADGFRVRRVDATTNTILTVAGNGSEVFSGDGGPATSAGLDSPAALWVDASEILYIADSSANRIRRVILTGTATYTGTIQGFGSNVVGVQSAAQTVTLTNTGLATLLIESISVSGTGFASTNTCGVSLAPLQSCTISATFKATATGTSTGSLSVVTSDSTKPVQTYALGGTGATVALVSIAVTPANPSVVQVLTQQFTATGTYSDASTQDLTKSADWKSASTAIATVSVVGVATGVAPGTTTITASSGSVSGSTGLTVTAPTLIGIQLTPTASYQIVGQAAQFTAAAIFSNGTQTNVTNSVVWKSSSPANATINATGVATGVALGTATISATMGTAPVSNTVAVTITPAGFVFTGSLNEPRYGHTATLLTNGKVLVAGGIDPTTATYLSGAELYDPVAGTFSFTGSLNEPRYIPATTLLNNGEVLVAGGDVSGAGTAELYNPQTGTFTPTGNLTTPRFYNSATLLQNGKVLIAGGLSGGTGTETTSAELYDPATGVFTPTGNMNVARTYHSATLLNNGQVLIAGGTGASGALTSAELYNPAAGTFALTGILNAAAQFAEGTLLNSGKVLVSGFAGPAELYDPGTGLFTNSATLNNLFAFFDNNNSPLLNNGTVLVVGGLSAGVGVYDAAQIYDPVSDTATNTGDLNNGRFAASTTLLSNGKVLVAGGYGYLPGTTTFGALSSAELYAPSSLTPANLLSITLTPSTPTIAVGGAVTFTATGTFVGGSTQVLHSVTWTSTNPAVATVTSDGTNGGSAFALTNGSTTISACAGGACGSTLLTVVQGGTLEVSPANTTIAKGSTQQFTAIAFTQLGLPFSVAATWSSSNSAIASINSSSGLASGVNTGSATITATYNGSTGSTTLTVGPPALVSIAITPVNPSVAAGLTQQFTATGTYTDGSTNNITSTVTWNSSVVGTATIAAAGGLAKGVAAGTTTISATLSGISGSTTLTVTAPVLVSIAVTPANPQVAAGLTQQFAATGTFSDGTTQNLTASVTWSSGTPGTATINAAGLATGVAAGTSTIKAVSGAISGSTSLSVVPATLVSVAVTPANSSLAAGLTQQFTATGTFTDGSKKNITSQVAWVSSNLGVATISVSGGLATARVAGGTTIKATAEISGSPNAAGSTSLTVTSSGAACLAPPQGLVSWYTGDGTTADFLGANPPVATNAITYAAGEVAQGFSVGTGGFIDIAPSASLTNQQFTFAAWVMPNGAGPGRYSEILDSGLLGVNGGFGLRWDSLNDNFLFDFGDGPIVSLDAFPAGQFYFVVGTYDGTTFRLYVNGIPEGNFVLVETITSSTNDWSIGSNNASLRAQGTPATWNGVIDEVQIFNRALTAAEIQSIVTAGGAGECKTSPATLVSIAITPANPSIAKGTTEQFTATGTYTDSSTKNITSSVTWSSAATGVATITAGGLASGVTAGTSTIEATLGNVLGSTVLTVTPATLVSIAVTPANPSIAKGLTQQFTATGTYSDTTTQNITGSVTWSSATASVATITSGGLTTGVGVGTSSIKATSGAISGSTTLTVTPATLVSIAVTPPNPSIAKGLTQQFTATGTYTDATTQNITATVTWSSATASVATVNAGGLASGVTAGTSLIKATLGAVAGSTTLTVTAPTLVSIAVTPANPSIAKGLTQQFTATGTYTDATTQNITATVTWSSATASVATVNASGLANGVAAGTSTIKATLGAVSGSTVLTVSPATLVSIAVTPATPSIVAGATQQFAATGTYSDATTQNITASVTWSSATGSVATISAGGLASGVAAGTSTIKAALGAVVGSTTLTVTPAAVLPTLTVTKAGKGSGTVTSQVGGIACGTGCAAQFPVGTVVVLTAVQASGSTFTGWGGACTNALGTCTVTLNASLAVTANFGLVQQQPAAGPFAYVPVSTANVLSIFDLSTNLPVTTINIGHQPFAAAVSPNGSAVYVSNSGDNTVAVLNPANNTIVATIPVGSIPGGFAITPDGSKVYVSTHGSNSVSVINAATNTAIASIPVGAYPFLMAASPDGKTVYVTNFNGASVSVISTATNTVTGTIQTGQEPQGIAISADGTTLYVACTSSNVVDVINTAAQKVISTIPVPNGPLGISLSPNGTTAFVSEYTGATTAVVNLAANAVVGSVAVGTNPYGNAFTPDGAFVWQTNSTSNVVSIISTATDAVVGTVPVTGSAFNVGIGASAPMAQTITQPLSPTAPNAFNFGPNAMTVTYPAGTSFAGVNMSVAATQANQQTFKQRVSATAFANATCVVYSGAGGNCVDYQITCTSSSTGASMTCPSVTTPTIEVKSTFDTAQNIVNPGFLTTPIGTNTWTNIFESFYLQSVDPTMKGRTRGFSEFVAVDLGAGNPQGAGTMTLLDPLTATDARMFPAGTTIPVQFTLTSVSGSKQPVTDATAGISVVQISDANGNSISNVVVDAPGAFTFTGGHYSYSLSTTGYAAGSYMITIYGNAFSAQQVGFVIPAATTGAVLTTTVQSLTVNKTTGQYLATIQIANTGGVAANGVTVTASSINSTATVTTMPLSLGSIAAGASTTATLAYPVSAGADGSRGAITVSESFAGGSAGLTLRVVLP